MRIRLDNVLNEINLTNVNLNKICEIIKRMISLIANHKEYNATKNSVYLTIFVYIYKTEDTLYKNEKILFQSIWIIVLIFFLIK